MDTAAWLDVPLPVLLALPEVPGDPQLRFDVGDTGSAGLSSSHILTNGILTFANGGNSLKLSIPMYSHYSRFDDKYEIIHTGDGPEVPRVRDESEANDVGTRDGYEWVRSKRGKIKQFSSKSRIRLLHKVGEIDRRAIEYMPMYITVTYHNEWPDDGPGLKRHLKALLTGLERQFGKAPILWKLEYQERGAPHFHMLVWYGQRSWMEWDLRKWVKDRWHQIATPGDEIAHRIGTRVEQVRSFSGSMWYTAHYLGKDTSDLRNDGRYWGVWHWDMIPRDISSYILKRAECYKIRRVLIKFRRRMNDLKGKARPKRGWNYREYHGTFSFIGGDTAERLVNWARDGPVPVDTGPGG